MSIWFPHKNISKTGLKPYAGDCPPYYNLNGQPWFDSLNKQLPEIKKKAYNLLYESKIAIQEFHPTLVNEGKWESESFLVCNIPRKLSKGQGKELFHIFKDIPGVISVFISVLNPHTHVKPHNGDTDAVYRLHIPIVIPATLPECGIKVNGIDRNWPQNEILVFCDAHMHEVWNQSDKPRVILIVDVMKPEYISQTRKVCTEVLAWMLLQKIVDALNILPAVIKGVIAYVTITIAKPFFVLLQRRPV